MRVIALALAMVLLASVSVCFANDVTLKKAYDLYYQGDKDMAIQMMEDYVRATPDPGVFYFLGYAYYEMQQMDKANEYFSEAFRLKDFYSPMPAPEGQ